MAKRHVDKRTSKSVHDFTALLPYPLSFTLSFTLYAHLMQAIRNAHTEFAEFAVTETGTGLMTGMMSGRVAGEAGEAEGAVVLAGGVQHTVEDAFDEHL